MGQAKRNPTAIAAKEGLLPPKPKPMGKREKDRLIKAAIVQKMDEKTGGFLSYLKGGY